MSTRRHFIRSLGALPPALALPRSWAAADASRLALVIGNSQYAESPLTNPANDAQAMGSLLGQAGYSVSTHLNATRVDMLGAIERFAAAARRSETQQVVFYFAGHGAQLDWRNYLLPVDARVQSAQQLRDSCVDLNQLIGELGKSKGKTFVIMLDACRNNPFGGGYQPEQKGLSQFDAPVGSLLAYATSPGNVASDGSGKNGLYTENLIRELSVRGARIEDALKRVRLNVRLASGGAQIPWETTSLENDVYIFNDGAPKLSEAEQERLVGADLAAWMRIKSSERMGDYVQYLREFPNGRFAEIVQARLTRLLAEAERARAQAKPVTSTPAGGKKPPPAEPAIHLAPGRPVPVFMAPSNNPYSAGSYPLGRDFNVGDRATFRQSDILTGIEKRRYTNRITGVHRETDRIEFNNGAAEADLMGNVVRNGDRLYDAPVQSFPAELQVGKKWKALGRQTYQGVTSDFFYDYQITRRESVTVPAGTFDAFVIEGSGWNQTFSIQLSQKIWVVPGLNFQIRREYITRNSRSQFRDVELHELVELVQNGVDQKCAAPLAGAAQRNLVIRNNCGS